MGVYVRSWRYGCPDCESRAIRQKGDGEAGRPREHDGDYRCIRCGSHFDQPADFSTAEGSANV